MYMKNRDGTAMIGCALNEAICPVSFRRCCNCSLLGPSVRPDARPTKLLSRRVPDSSPARGEPGETPVPPAHDSPRVERTRTKSACGDDNRSSLKAAGERSGGLSFPTEDRSVMYQCTEFGSLPTLDLWLVIHI